MKFKTEQSKKELEEGFVGLRQLALEFERECARYGIEPTVTRVKGKIAGDSGVHAAGRAVDFRDQTFDADGDAHFVFTQEQRDEISRRINSRVKRSDNRPTIIWHSFKGGPLHAHLQIEATAVNGIYGNNPRNEDVFGKKI